MKRHKTWNKECIYDFQRYEAMRFFGYSIYTRKANIAEVEEDQSNLLKNIVEFNNKCRPRSKEVRIRIGGIFPLKPLQGKGLEILTSKQVLQRLPQALAQVKEGNTSENLLIEISQIMHFLYLAKEITKKYIKI